MATVGQHPAIVSVLAACLEPPLAVVQARALAGGLAAHLHLSVDNLATRTG